MQLDFIGNIFRKTKPEQMELGEKASPVTCNVERFFHSITKDEIKRHKEIWDELTPDTDSEMFKRYLFAFMSVHTTWESNIKGYENIANWLKWINNDAKLLDLLKDSGVGLHNNRTKFISAFTQDYWANCKKYQKKKDETWVECRDRIEKTIKGLGLAKSSFSLEMIYPLECNVSCMDVHLFRFYGLNQTKHLKQYKTIEAHWVEWSKMFNLPAYISRVIWWNRNQGQKDCWYWATVLK